MSEPTIYEVAKEAGVSAATVSRAINGRDRISETTRQKVFDACAKLGFSASKTASNAANRKDKSYSTYRR